MIADLVVTFWQPVVVGVLIIIGFLISKFDGQGASAAMVLDLTDSSKSCCD